MTEPQATYVAGDRGSPERRVRACGTCRFFSETSQDGSGVCRINPPTVLLFDGDCISSWPILRRKDWCGMWQHDRRGNQPEGR